MVMTKTLTRAPGKKCLLIFKFNIKKKNTINFCFGLILFSDLMKLKRTNVARQSKEGGKKSDALISRFAPGFCFDVHPNDPNV